MGGSCARVHSDRLQECLLVLTESKYSIANVNPADDGQPMKQHNVEVGVEVRMTLWKKGQ